LKRYYQKENIILDISIHTEEEMPIHRKQLYSHNKRSIYQQIDICLYGKLLYGENLYIKKSFNIDHIQEECVIIINSLLYNLRKICIQELDEKTIKRRLLILALNAPAYALAFYGIFPKEKKQIYEQYDSNIQSNIKAKELLAYKLQNYAEN